MIDVTKIVASMLAMTYMTMFTTPRATPENNGSTANERQADGCRCAEPADSGTLYCKKCIFKYQARRWLGDSAKWLGLKTLFDQQSGCCAYTGVPIKIGHDASIDHKIPRSRGGGNGLDNLQWVSWEVNRMKTDMTHEDFLKMCQRVLDYQKKVTENNKHKDE